MIRFQILTIIFIIAGCATNDFTTGYHEVKAGETVWDESIVNGRISSNNFVMVNDALSPVQIRELGLIVHDTTLHLESNLGTCDVTGVFVAEGLKVFTTCGTSQIWICEGDSKHAVLLSDDGNERLFQLTRQVRGIGMTSQ